MGRDSTASGPRDGNVTPEGRTPFWNDLIWMVTRKVTKFNRISLWLLKRFSVIVYDFVLVALSEHRRRTFSLKTRASQYARKIVVACALLLLLLACHQLTHAELG